MVSCPVGMEKMFSESIKWPEREADVISVHAGLKMNVILSLPLPIRLYTSDNTYEIITDVFGSNHDRAIYNRGWSFPWFSADYRQMLG